MRISYSNEVVFLTTVVLIRHGETDWNHVGRLQGREDIPLNDSGRWQARQCGDFLRGSAWNVIVSSPLKRARETAALIHAALSSPVPLVQLPQFLERDYGLASGLTMEECGALYQQGEYPEAETWEDLRKRALAGLEHVRVKYPEGKVLLVAHGGVINAILATVSGGEIGTGKTRLLNASLSQIQFRQGAWRVDYYNQTQHLLDLHRA